MHTWDLESPETYYVSAITDTIILECDFSPGEIQIVMIVKYIPLMLSTHSVPGQYLFVSVLFNLTKYRKKLIDKHNTPFLLYTDFDEN